MLDLKNDLAEHNQTGDVIKLDSVDFEFPIELLYEDVILESEEQ